VRPHRHCRPLALCYHRRGPVPRHFGAAWGRITGDAMLRNPLFRKKTLTGLAKTCG